MKPSLALLLFSLSAALAQAASFTEPVGLQLYSLRADFAKNVPATVEVVKGFGIKEVELAGTYGQTPADFKKLLVANGLKPVSGHFGYDLYKTNLDAVVKDAVALGLKYAGCAWITHTDPFNEKTCREAAEVFNKAGAALAKHGIKFFYHVHGYEFQPFGGETLLDLLFKETNPKWVSYEMDIFWIVFPNQDPVKLLQKYPKRWELMHLKDMNKAVKTGPLTGHTDVTNDVTIGTGQLNFPAILRQAKKNGIKHYFIEDESPISKDQIPQSIKYLKSVKF